MEWICRPGTEDAGVVREVYTQNFYHLLLENIAGYVVCDVGAHIGTFTRLCLDNGAAFVSSYEAASDTFCLLAQHCSEYVGQDRVHVNNLAVWRNDMPPMELTIFQHPQGNLCGSRTCAAPTGATLERCATWPLDWALRDLIGRFGRCDLLKIDAECAEYPAFYTSELLAQVPNIVGEFHYCTKIVEEAYVEGTPGYNLAGFKGFLEGLGYQFVNNLVPWGGNFWASRDNWSAFSIPGINA